MNDERNANWPGEPQEEPDFGPPGPADHGAFDQRTPPPPHVAPRLPPPPAAGWSGPPPVGPVGGPAPRNGQAVAALATGILALVFSVLCALLGIPLAIVAIVLGLQGRKQARATGTSGGLAVAGLTMGVLALLIVVGWTVLAFTVGDV